MVRRVFEARVDAADDARGADGVAIQAHDARKAAAAPRALRRRVRRAARVDSADDAGIRRHARLRATGARRAIGRADSRPIPPSSAAPWSRSIPPALSAGVARSPSTPGLRRRPPDADLYTRYEVIGWYARTGQSAVSVTKTRTPDTEWFSAAPQVIRDLRGADAQAVIDKLRGGRRVVSASRSSTARGRAPTATRSLRTSAGRFRSSASRSRRTRSARTTFPPAKSSRTRRAARATRRRSRDSSASSPAATKASSSTCWGSSRESISSIPRSSFRESVASQARIRARSCGRRTLRIERSQADMATKRDHEEIRSSPATELEPAAPANGRAVPRARGKHRRLRDLHAGCGGTRHQLEHRSGAPQGLPRGRDRRPALLALLSARGDRARHAPARARGGLRQGPLRGRRLAAAEGRLVLLGQRRHHAGAGPGRPAARASRRSPAISPSAG